MRPIAKTSITKPYWLSAANYYVLTIAVAMAVFVLVFGLLRDEYREAYIPAGIASSAVMAFAVVIRLALLRKYQMRAQAARRLDQNLNAMRLLGAAAPKKLTIEKNASILRHLKRKSDAAATLARHADGHREVFELCSQYLELNTSEMLTVNPGSPRIAALRRGREVAEELHQRHMLKWAEIETTDLFDKAQRAPKNLDKIALAGEALQVIEMASQRYPREPRLIESASAINEFVVTSKISGLIERAAKAEDRGNSKLAVRHLQTALGEMDESCLSPSDRELVANMINEKLKRLQVDFE
jgi:hypothetical protein